tara:strand:- start:2658 stop:2993 length:336 start_codon:yes stop_codon:yes gene_type:complete
MILLDSPLGVKRRLKIVGFIEWDDVQKFLICKFFIESIDAQGNLLTDKVVNQSREVRYAVTNTNKVNAQFNPVQTGGTGEYDFFRTYLDTNLLIPSYTLLATKLNERGIFD